MKKIVNAFKKIIKGKNKYITIVIVALLLIAFAPFQKVEIGQKGVKYNSLTGEIQSDISAGWHVVFPLAQEMVSYPTNNTIYKIYRDNKNWNNGIDASIVTATKDRQEISVDVTFIFSLDEKKLEYIFKKFNGKDIDEIKQEYLNDIFKNSVISTITQYSAYEVYSTRRGEVEEIVCNELSEKLLDDGIIMKDVYLDTVRLSEETEAIIKAESLAEAARIEAQGKSDANKLISESLTENIMSYESLQKISESLKLIIVPSGADGQIDYSKIIEQILNSSDGKQEDGTN